MAKVIQAAIKKAVIRRQYKLDAPTQEQWLDIIEDIFVVGGKRVKEPQM